MSRLDEVRTLRSTALRLPGFWQARTQLDLAIEVLEYFAREAETPVASSRNDVMKTLLALQVLLLINQSDHFAILEQSDRATIEVSSSGAM